jgi:hypothetical protein
MHEDVDLTNFSQHPTSFRLTLDVDADFADLGDLHGERVPGEITRGRRTLDGADELDIDYRAERAFEHQGERGTARAHRGLTVRVRNVSSPATVHDRGVAFEVSLPADATWHACVDWRDEQPGRMLHEAHTGPPRDVERQCVKTPLHARLKAAGRLIADSVGDQFVFTNVVPAGMSRLDLYEGYRGLLNRLYDYRHYRKRAVALILSRGPSLRSRVLSRRDDLAVVGRIAWHCIVRASPRRAWLTLSLCLETAWRRPARSATRSPLRSCTSISMSTHEQRRSSSTFSSKSFGNRNRAERHQRRRRRRLVEQMS